MSGTTCNSSQDTAYQHKYFFLTDLCLTPEHNSRFAIDTSRPSMTPKDPAITSVGGHELSAGDIGKLQASYGCEGTSHSGCGGYRTGGGTSLQGGRVGVTGSSQWVLAMQWSWWFTVSLWVSLSILPVQCPSDYPQVACPDTLTVHDGTSTGGLSLGEFCGSSTPTVIHSLDSSMFISFSRAGSGSQMSALWRKVPGKARSKLK